MPVSKPYIIGLTGGIGCGKSEAAAYLASLGAFHIDADAISHELTAPNGGALGAIHAQFGDEVFAKDGALDRAALGKIVFESEPHRRALEAILHPLVQNRTLELIQEASARSIPIVILNVPLLYESGMDVLCDETWTVCADAETQLNRVMARGLSEAEARVRISSQMTPEQRGERAQRTIWTNRPVEKTWNELNALYQQALRRANA
ncbi:MAG: dephospho-CoA kinase [Clostridia bacterium]|nr:dephospho-CoA kinase [Clostridia bacterium]